MWENADQNNAEYGHFLRSVGPAGKVAKMITTNIAKHEDFCTTATCNHATLLKKESHPNKVFCPVNLEDCNLQLYQKKDSGGVLFQTFRDSWSQMFQIIAILKTFQNSKESTQDNMLF